MNIKQIVFPESQYIKEEFAKKQVYLHHTAGNSSGESTFKYWANNKERIATCVCISDDGTIVQGFSSKYWAYHLGLAESTFYRFNLPYKSLDRISIGIEICNWGYLKEKNGKFYNYVGIEIPQNDVIQLSNPYKGYSYFHNYTDAQIESVKQLLILWNTKYGIPLDYNDDIWDLCPRAFKGDMGVFTHNSVRKDKSDIYPHPKMVEMLKSLTK
jgi:N-acetyl-anhydromuramyl-L-alanine amidase AmpD